MFDKSTINYKNPIEKSFEIRYNKNMETMVKNEKKEKNANMKSVKVLNIIAMVAYVLATVMTVCIIFMFCEERDKGLGFIAVIIAMIGMYMALVLVPSIIGLISSIITVIKTTRVYRESRQGKGYKTWSITLLCYSIIPSLIFFVVLYLL